MRIARTMRCPGTTGIRIDDDLLAFTRRLIRFRLDHPVFHRRRWFQGRAIHDSGERDIGWFTPDGEEMTEEHWRVGFAKSLLVLFNGKALPDPDSRGERVTDSSFLVLFNAHYEASRLHPARSRLGHRVDQAPRHRPGRVDRG